MNPVTFCVASLRSMAMGWLASQIAVTAVVRTFISEWPHWWEGIPGLLMGWVIGIDLVRKERHRRSDAVLIPIGPLLAGGAVGMLRAGLLAGESDLSSAGVFFALAVVLCIASVVATVSIWLGKEQLVGYSISVGAVVIAVFACYLSGHDSLRFEKQADASVASATLQRFRWLDSRLSSEQRLEAVSGWEHEQELELPGMNVVLKSEQAESRLVLFGDSSATKTLPYHVTKSLAPFLESKQVQLELTQSTPYWPLPVVMLLAGVVLLSGVAWLPGENESPLKFLDRSLKWTGVVTVVVTSLTSLGLLIGASSKVANERDTARTELAQRGAIVASQDLTFRGNRLMSDAWHVKVRSTEFGNQQLTEWVPFLKKAPGLSLDLSETKVTDDGVRLLRDVSFKMLYLRSTEVTNEMLGQFRYNVEFLDVRETAVNIKGLEKHSDVWLKNLLISDSDVTLDDIHILYSTNGLEYVGIYQSKITPLAFDAWRKNIPDLPNRPIIEFPDQTE